MHARLITLVSALVGPNLKSESVSCEACSASYCIRFEEFSLSNQEVNTIEKQVLFLLDWNLSFQISELEHHLEPFLIRVRDSTARIRSISYRGNQEVLVNRKAQGKIQSSKTNTKITKSVSERKEKQPFTTRKEVLIDSPSTVVVMEKFDS